MTQNAKGPAEAATSPSRGSTNLQKDTEMNRTEHSTAAAGRPVPFLPTHATVKELMNEIQEGGAITVDQQLEALIDLFAKAARAIDPSIITVWVGRGGEGLDRPCFVSMERVERATSRRAV
ncbi:hypothetical protein LP421_07915 [Rhizobium sp. RCAM05350]|nr:hypothetical protein LP421_07915 [Rhizobium sp. RCAM05350]